MVRDINRNYTEPNGQGSQTIGKRSVCSRVSWADPEIVEQWQWRGAPGWSHRGRLEFQRRKTRVDTYTPISSFHSVGFRAMNSFIRRMHSSSCTISTVTPRCRSSSSSPMNVRFSPTITRGIP